MSDNKTIAIVEDDGAVRAAYRDLMRSCGLKTKMFECAEDFLAHRWDEQARCLILDHRLPGLSGLELLEVMKTRSYHLPVVFITSQDDETTRRKALASGAMHFLSKPINPDKLLECLEDAIGGNGAERFSLQS